MSPIKASELPQDILGAVARGWCAPENAHKVMDEQLAFAIAREVAALSAPSADAQPVAEHIDTPNPLPPHELHGSTDANLWASTFCARNPGSSSFGIMLAWFANALMTAHSSPTTAPASESIDSRQFVDLLNAYAHAPFGQDEAPYQAILAAISAHIAAQVAIEKAETKRMLDTACMYQDLYSKAVEVAQVAASKPAKTDQDEADMLTIAHMNGYEQGKREASKPAAEVVAGGLTNELQAFSCNKPVNEQCRNFCGNHLICFTTSRKHPTYEDFRVMFEAWISDGANKQEMRILLKREGDSYSHGPTHHHWQSWSGCARTIIAALNKGKAV